jgi:glycosyltransferase involved in cell wall biosynthesis
MQSAAPTGDNSEPRVRRSLHEDPRTGMIVNAAISDFHAEYGANSLPKLVVVIAALNEEQSIGAVIDEVPSRIGGVDAAVLVVDDGSTDKTEVVSRERHAFVCSLAENCGHGAALRAGYRIAREAGASYIGTLDADGQWDPADLPAMVRLLEDDKADFVIGSRQLGRTENNDAVRNLGVRFFSLAISALTRTKITDSSSGLRAMRAELTGRVRQTQPQYQTSELLIGAIFAGYRIAEVPTTMRVRMAGVSHKGKNIFYGVRYAQVITKTWWREKRHPLAR